MKLAARIIKPMLGNELVQLIFRIAERSGSRNFRKNQELKWTAEP